MSNEKDLFIKKRQLNATKLEYVIKQILISRRIDFICLLLQFYPYFFPILFFYSA